MEPNSVFQLSGDVAARAGLRPARLLRSPAAEYYVRQREDPLPSVRRDRHRGISTTGRVPPGDVSSPGPAFGLCRGMKVPATLAYAT